MTFLQTHNLPTTACFVSRHLSSRPDGVAESELIERLCPASLEGPAGKENDKAGGYATKHTIAALRSIGLIGGDSSRMFLTAAEHPTIQSTTPDQEILQIVRRALFSHSDSSSCWSIGKRGWDTSGANDFLRAACWFVGQDPLGPPFAFDLKGPARSAERVQRQQFKDGRPRLLNQTSWDDFTRWACAIGLARRTRLRGIDYLTPDPTVLIGDELMDLLEVDKWYSIRSVLHRLAERLPIVGPGFLREHMLEHMRAPPKDVGGRTEDPTLSQAIITLADKKLIACRALSDASDQRLLWDRPEHQSITHLKVLEV